MTEPFRFQHRATETVLRPFGVPLPGPEAYVVFDFCQTFEKDCGELQLEHLLNAMAGAAEKFLELRREMIFQQVIEVEEST
jgi:hypothetical protein